MNERKQTILIVDDTPDNIMLLSRLLKDRYHTKVATNGSTALQIANATTELDLILLDVMMPGVDGYETCRQLKANPGTADIPIIFLSAKSQVEDEAMGLSLGAADYLTKPISPPILFARVDTQLTLLAARRELKSNNARLAQMVGERSAQLSLLQEANIMAAAAAAEERAVPADRRTRRLRNYVLALARRLQQHARFRRELTDENVELLYKSVALEPVEAGADLAAGLDSQQEGRAAGFLMYARQVARWRQEKWDGSGFPDHLAGEDIPLAARLMAVTEVYDALTTQRVCKAALSHAQALSIMEKGRASHFDPDILDALLEVEGRFAAIATELADDEEEQPGSASL